MGGIEETSLRRRFRPRRLPKRDVGAYVSAAVSAARDRYQARVILHAPLAKVAKRVPPSYGALEAIDEETCLLRTGADWLGGLAVYVAMIGVDFEVLEPPELIDEVRALADRFTRTTQRDDAAGDREARVARARRSRSPS